LIWKVFKWYYANLRKQILQSRAKSDLEFHNMLSLIWIVKYIGEEH